MLLSGLSILFCISMEDNDEIAFSKELEDEERADKEEGQQGMLRDTGQEGCFHQRGVGKGDSLHGEWESDEKTKEKKAGTRK